MNMRKFKEFITCETVDPIWNFPPLRKGFQPGQAPVGGFQNFGHIAQWRAQNQLATALYPQTNFTYQQVEWAIYDLSDRIRRLVQFVDTKGSMAVDPTLPGSVRNAEYETTNNGVNPQVVVQVDGTYFYGHNSSSSHVPTFEVGQQFPQRGTAKILEDDGAGKFRVSAVAMQQAIQETQEQLQNFNRSLERMQYRGQIYDKVWNRLTNHSYGGSQARADANPLKVFS